MATAFAAADSVLIGNIGPRHKKQVYKLQLPSAWTAAGQAWDLSDDFTEVTAYSFGPSGAITDHGFGKFDMIGTFGTYGMTASTIKIVCHQTGSADGAVFTSAADSEDFSGADDMVVTIEGYLA